MVRGLRKPGDLLARSDLCHLHDGREEAEACAIEPKLQRQERDVVLVARSGSNQHVWVVRRSLSEIFMTMKIHPASCSPRSARSDNRVLRYLGIGCGASTAGPRSPCARRVPIRHG